MGGESEQKVNVIHLDVTPELAYRNPLQIWANTDYALCVTLHYEKSPKVLVGLSSELFFLLANIQ